MIITTDIYCWIPRKIIFGFVHYISLQKCTVRRICSGHWFLYNFFLLSSPIYLKEVFHHCCNQPKTHIRSKIRKKHPISSLFHLWCLMKCAKHKFKFSPKILFKKMRFICEFSYSKNYYSKSCMYHFSIGKNSEIVRCE